MNANRLEMAGKSPAPWYRQGWPWFLVAFPAAAVIGGIITFILAVNTWDGLVVDDYYKEGGAIVQTIERTRLARELGLSARLGISDGRLRVTLLSGKNTGTIPEQIRVTVAHPTHGGKDQILSLSGHGGVFEGAVEPLAAGRWLLQIEDEARTWRMNGAAYLPTETEVDINPAS